MLLTCFLSKICILNFLFYISTLIDWHLIFEFFTFIVALFAYWQARKAGIFDKTPNVIASGVFIISKSSKVNKERDQIIKDDNIQTLQLFNIGRGYAKSIIPSKNEVTKGELLEDLCPHEFNLPPRKSTNDYNEVVRINGGNFNKKALFIFYKDTDGKEYCTKVNCDRINYSSIIYERNADLDDKQKSLFIENKTEEYLELWKVSENKSCNCV